MHYWVDMVGVLEFGRLTVVKGTGRCSCSNIAIIVVSGVVVP